jgi:hypothetical protein
MPGVQMISGMYLVMAAVSKAYPSAGQPPGRPPRGKRLRLRRLSKTVIRWSASHSYLIVA